MFSLYFNEWATGNQILQLFIQCSCSRFILTKLLFLKSNAHTTVAPGDTGREKELKSERGWKRGGGPNRGDKGQSHSRSQRCRRIFATCVFVWKCLERCCASLFAWPQVLKSKYTISKTASCVLAIPFLWFFFQTKCGRGYAFESNKSIIILTWIFEKNRTCKYLALLSMM